ncbi:DUF1659 domain-containing protein [Evansella tamaricis]|uniref:DUF1659 domain-containing protein n=1 Tax=Evansella tamaricis TaxID=2069301 RepID=A0ABS6JDG0_9BACI|nr:DUF1659 domain-containing protein [Evansella tamaricis]MBU9711435.1 DUF1659 domain-containing protein [Evansella tamaricis]
MGELTVSRLALAFIVGYEEDGEAILKVKQFRNIQPGAENENLFNTALALASLQKYELENVERVNTYNLVQ